MLEKTEGIITNGQSRDTGYKKHRTKTNRHRNTIQKTKPRATQTLPKPIGGVGGGVVGP